MELDLDADPGSIPESRQPLDGSAQDRARRRRHQLSVMIDEIADHVAGALAPRQQPEAAQVGYRVEVRESGGPVGVAQSGSDLAVDVPREPRRAEPEALAGDPFQDLRVLAEPETYLKLVIRDGEIVLNRLTESQS